jgi:hypothetical protein
MSWSSRGRSCGFRFFSPLIQSSSAELGGLVSFSPFLISESFLYPVKFDGLPASVLEGLLRLE